VPAFPLLFVLLVPVVLVPVVPYGSGRRDVPQRPRRRTRRLLRSKSERLNRKVDVVAVVADAEVSVVISVLAFLVSAAELRATGEQSQRNY